MLLRGPSGAGKSDLALRAMAAGWRLVADDRTLVWRSGGRLFGRAPDTIAGLVEARGVGVTAVGFLPFAELALAADLVDSPDAIERMPEFETVELAGLTLRRMALFPQESSAVAKLTLALQASPLGCVAEEAYQAPFARKRPKRPPRRGDLL